MNDYVVGIDIGEKESVATYMSPYGDILEQFSFEPDFALFYYYDTPLK